VDIKGTITRHTSSLFFMLPQDRFSLQTLELTYPGRTCSEISSFSDCSLAMPLRLLCPFHVGLPSDHHFHEVDVFEAEKDAVANNNAVEAKRSKASLFIHDVEVVDPDDLEIGNP
jgi:hypothetical protein